MLRMLGRPPLMVAQFLTLASLWAGFSISLTRAFGQSPMAASPSQAASPASPPPSSPVRDGGTKILCLGDSLTDGYGVPREAAWPALLESELKAKGQKINVVNAGISGSTSASGLSRLKWQLKSPQKPQILILALGANDGLRGIDLKSTKANLESVIKLAQQNHLKVILVGMQMPANYGSTYTEEFSKLFTDLAKTYQTGLIPFLLEGVALDKKLNQNDGIHPNEDGYKRVVLNVVPHVLKVLGG